MGGTPTSLALSKGNQMPTLRLVRDSGYVDYLRVYAVLLDGTTILELRNAQTQDVPVSTAEHSLSVRIDWCGSKPIRFAATDGETVIIHVTSSLRGWRILLVLWY